MLLRKMFDETSFHTKCLRIGDIRHPHLEQMACRRIRPEGCCYRQYRISLPQCRRSFPALVRLVISFCSHYFNSSKITRRTFPPRSLKVFIRNISFFITRSFVSCLVTRNIIIPTLSLITTILFVDFNLVL